MSLIVWLPLNGDLENQGLSNVTVTNNGATIDNNGKIGKCYSFSSSNSAYLQLPQLSINRSEMSFCVWAKYGAWDNWSRLFDFGATSGAGDTLLLSHNGTSNSFYVGCKTGGTGRDFSYAANLSLNTWYHFAIIKKGLEWKLYLNGNLVYTTNLVGDFSTDPVIFKNNFLGRSNWSQDSYLNGQLNDFRIYDHALSAKEVKELAKGLVLHYRLAGPGQENLFVNSHFDSKTTISAWDTTKNGTLVANSWGGYNEGVSNPTTVYHAHLKLFNGEYVYEYIKTASETWEGISQGGLQSKIKASTTYTFSCDEYSDGKNWISGAGLYFRKTGSTSYKFYTGAPPLKPKKVNSWERVSYSFTTPADIDLTQNISFYIYGTAGNGTFYIKNPKLELGSVATPWMPHTSDTLYSAMGYNNNIEYDCSGYRRNGTKSGHITWDVDSARYTTSYSALSDYPIKAEVNMPSCDSMTISFWTKITTFGTAKSGLFATSNMSTDPTDYNDTAMAQRDSDIDLKGVSGSGKIFSFTAPSTGQWHHCVFVYDGSKVYYYQDGKKINEEACAIGALKPYQYFYLGYSKAGGVVRKTLGKWSDLRIYATALSAEDIAELYHSAVIVDNTGKNYAYEYFEAN